MEEIVHCRRAKLVGWAPRILCLGFISAGMTPFATTSIICTRNRLMNAGMTFMKNRPGPQKLARVNREYKFGN